MEKLLSMQRPTFAGTDLVTVFETGLKGSNQPANVKPGEMTRLNTSIARTPLAAQDPLDAINLTGFEGFSNGKRLVDDVVDITLSVAEGLLCTERFKAAIPSKRADTVCGVNVGPKSSALPFTDGARSTNVDIPDITFL